MIEIRAKDSDSVLLRIPADDLAGASLAGLALPGADLAGADLRGVDLRGTDLSKARLAGAGVGSRSPLTTPTSAATAAVETVAIATGPAGRRRSRPPRRMIRR